MRSFVFDVADLYKAEVAIPIAFEMAARQPEDLPAETRRAVRDAIHDGAILTRCAADVRRLLLPDDGSEETDLSADLVQLWDGGERRVVGGASYGEDDVPW